MRSRVVTQYSCDFCKKRGLSAGHMRNHEKRCTMNPDRGCRLCDFAGGGSALSVAEMIERLPKEKDYQRSELCDDRKTLAMVTDYDWWAAAINLSLPALREDVDCPACLLAALRQAKIPVPIVTGFDFKAETAAVFQEYNEENRQDY